MVSFFSSMLYAKKNTDKLRRIKCKVTPARARSLQGLMVVNQSVDTSWRMHLQPASFSEKAAEKSE